MFLNVNTFAGNMLVLEKTMGAVSGKENEHAPHPVVHPTSPPRGKGYNAARVFRDLRTFR